MDLLPVALLGLKNFIIEAPMIRSASLADFFISRICYLHLVVYP